MIVARPRMRAGGAEEVVECPRRIRAAGKNAKRELSVALRRARVSPLIVENPTV